MTSTTSLVPTAEPEPSLIKTDVLGRVQRTREQRERILDEYQRSGLSGPKFAALCGVKYQTFSTWLARHKSQSQTHPKRQHQPKAPTQVQWLEGSLQRKRHAKPLLTVSLRAKPARELRVRIGHF